MSVYPGYYMLMDSGKGWEGESAVLQSPWMVVKQESQLELRVHMNAHPQDTIAGLKIIRTSKVGFPEELLDTVRAQGSSGWFTYVITTSVK